MNMGVARVGPRLGAVAWPLATCCLLALASGAMARGATQVAAPPGERGATSADATDLLAKVICARIKPLGAQAKGTMLEALIVYELSQNTESSDVKVAALNELGQACPTGGLGYIAGAINRALRAGSLGGTAGLNDGYGIESSYFSAPLVNIGGGSANYRSGG